MSSLRERPDWQWLLALGLLLPFKYLLTTSAGLELHFDEAQYWEWSQQLDWSYYSKGPLIAWLIALGTGLFGHGEWQVRLFGWLIHSGFLAVMFLFARDVWGSRAAGWWAVALTVTTPLYFSLSLVMTTDNLLLLFWGVGLWQTWRALICNRSRAWYGVGAAVGLGALTKLSIGLMPLMVGIGVLLRPVWWHHLRSAHLWGALGLMLLCMSPLLYWNATHDWVMFRHEMGHVGGRGSSWSQVGGFVLGQWLVLSPLVAGLAVASLWRRPADAGQRWLWWLGLAWIGFFLFKAVNGKVQLNWPAPSYLGFIVLFAGLIPGFSQARRRLLLGGMALSVMLVIAAFTPSWLGLGAKQDPFRELKAWRAPLSELAQRTPPVDFILTDRYTLAAELAFYWPQRLPVYITGSASRRYNQHDLWPGLEREAGRNGVFVTEGEHPPAELARAFRVCRALPPLEVRARRGDLIRRLQAWYCSGYQPIIWPKPNRY